MRSGYAGPQASATGDRNAHGRASAECHVPQIWPGMETGAFFNNLPQPWTRRNTTVISRLIAELFASKRFQDQILPRISRYFAFELIVRRDNTRLRTIFQTTPPRIAYAIYSLVSKLICLVSLLPCLCSDTEKQVYCPQNKNYTQGLLTLKIATGQIGLVDLQLWFLGEPGSGRKRQPPRQNRTDWILQEWLRTASAALPKNWQISKQTPSPRFSANQLMARSFPTCVPHFPDRQIHHMKEEHTW